MIKKALKTKQEPLSTSVRDGLLEGLTRNDVEVLKKFQVEYPEMDWEQALWGTKTLIKVAAEKGADECLSWLIHKGVNVNSSLESSELSPLMCAVLEGQVKAVQVLLKANARVDQRHQSVPGGLLHEGQTALMYACAKRRKEIVSLLIEAGADVNASNGQGITPLMVAVRKQWKEGVSMLIEAGADVNRLDQWKESALMGAYRHHDEKIMTRLIHAGADVNVQNEKGLNLIMVMAEKGELQAVKTMVNLKAELDRKDETGRTALMRAVEKGHREVVLTLLKAGADWKVEDHQGYSAHTLALLKGHAEIALELMKLGRKPELFKRQELPEPWNQPRM